MGLFDNLFGAAKEIAEGAKTAFENINREMDEAASRTGNVGQGEYDAPPAALPPVPLQSVLRGCDVRLMISGDFTQHEGYTRSTFSVKYDPEHLSVLEYDDENEITVSLLEGVGDFVEIGECVGEFLSGGSVDAIIFEAFPEGRYLFKAKIESSDYMMYFYVLRKYIDDPFDADILLLFYPAEVEGTELERKLMSCFDEAAKTLTITV
ncbi:MAG: hypothetical protein K6C68_09955 [Ruminococcus sp.]|nr:hypothetical protein [Ruminococcus sp.]